MVLALSIIGVVVGIALGLRFKVLVLMPAIALAAMFALTIGLAHGGSFGSIVLAMVIVGAAIQLGYFVGIFLAKPMTADSAAQAVSQSAALRPSSCESS